MSDNKRSDLALSMLCAWNNIPPDKAPPEWWNHPNDLNRIAWERVAKAARDHLSAEFGGMDERLSNNKLLEEFVYNIFYANPIENGRQNLVIAIQRYLRGEPLVSEEEKQRAALDSLSAEDRAAWWRKRNAELLEAKG